MPHSVNLPAAACAFAATVEVGTNGENAKTAPLKLFARSTSPVFMNEEVGYVVHDFAGMRLNKPRIAVDYCHDAEKVIGYANHFERDDDYGLVANGALVPYSNDPEDKATEVIYKSQNGVPYEASITMDREVIAEKVREGKTTQVNGMTLSGPLTVFREWTLRGIAVCPYGKDKNTLSALAMSDDTPVVSVTFQEEEAEMPVEENKPVEAEAPAVEAEAVQHTPEVETPAPAAEVVEASPAEEQPQPEVAPVEAVALSVKDEDLNGLKFLECFGEKGGVWFAQGKTFREAQDLHFAEIKAERDRLATENEQLKTHLSANRGEAEPVSFSVDNAEPVKPDPKKFSNLGDGLGKFAANIKFKK